MYLQESSNHAVAILPWNFVRSVVRNTDPSLGRRHSFPVTSSESSIASGCPRRLRRCTRRWAGPSVCSQSADSVSPNAGSRSSFFVSFFFFFPFFFRCYSSESRVEPLAKYRETIPIPATRERDRYGRCIVADRRSWIVLGVTLPPEIQLHGIIATPGNERFCSPRNSSRPALARLFLSMPWPKLSKTQKEKEGCLPLFPWTDSSQGRERDAEGETRSKLSVYFCHSAHSNNTSRKLWPLNFV